MANEADDKYKVSTAWRWRSRASGFMAAHLYSAPDSKYLKPKTNVLLVMKDAYRKQLRTWFARMPENMLETFLTPTKATPALVLQLTGEGREQTMNISFELAGQRKMPSDKLILEDGSEWTGLDNSWVRKDQTITDDQFHKFRLLYQSAIKESNAKSNVEDSPDASGTDPWAAQSQKANGRPSNIDTGVSDNSDWVMPSQEGNGKVASTDEEICYIRVQDAQRPELRLGETYPDARFGNPPAEPNDYCDSLCEYNLECRKKAGLDDQDVVPF